MWLVSPRNGLWTPNTGALARHLLAQGLCAEDGSPSDHIIHVC